MNQPLIEQLRQALGEQQIVNPPLGDLKPAAVLVLLYPEGDDYKVVLTKRTALVASHKGEVCFPGGRFEPGRDRSLVDTALRESAEEIGLRIDQTEVLGRLEPRATRFRYLVAPFVATLRAPQRFRPQPTEVEEILEIPLPYLRTPEAISSEPRTYGNVNISTPYYCFNDHVIWGATARILRQFLALLPSASSLLDSAPSARGVQRPAER